MNIVVIGSGYVGLVTGCCLAQAGNQVTCVDHDGRKVAALQAGHTPFHEPGLQEVMCTQLNSERLKFETSIARAMQGADAVFLAVGTPSQEDGNANLDNLLRCAHELADTAFGDCIVIIKSTVPVGTGDKVEAILNAGYRRTPGQPRLSVVSNPEFLAEGRAVQDFCTPDRVVIGSDDAHAIAMLKKLYAPFVHDGERLMVMDRRSAEFSKYACNAMLAARISVVNELANLAGGLGADIMQVCRVIRSDSRIGPSYLQPGAGYGGSCLPKDLHALIYAAQCLGEPAELLRSVQSVNQGQRERPGCQPCRGRRAGRNAIRLGKYITAIQSLCAGGLRTGGCPGGDDRMGGVPTPRWRRPFRGDERPADLRRPWYVRRPMAM